MQPEDIDKLFRDQLQHHAPAPPAYLWEQLEAEIKPAHKRPTLWLYAAAAMVALLLVAGSAWLLRTPGFPGGGTGTVATTSAPHPATGRQPAAQAPKKTTPTQATVATEFSSSRLEDQQSPTDVATTTAAASAATITKKAIQRAILPKAASAAAGAQPAVVAQATAQKTAKASRLAPVPAQAVALASSSALAAAQPERPAGTDVAPVPSPSTPVTPAGPIEVEVHRGTDASLALAAADAPQSYQSDSHLKNLFHKAKTAVKDGRVKLPKVELPETVTVQVNVFNHSATKVIQL